MNKVTFNIESEFQKTIILCELQRVLDKIIFKLNDNPKEFIFICNQIQFEFGGVNNTYLFFQSTHRMVENFNIANNIPSKEANILESAWWHYDRRKERVLFLTQIVNILKNNNYERINEMFGN